MAERIRILIADDRPRSRDGLKALFSTYPEVEVIGEAANGLEVVDFVEVLQPDVVLMDTLMPLLDGFEATRKIKDRSAHIKVVLLSIDGSFRSRAYAAGADAFLIKGCPGEEILEAVLCEG